MDADFKDDLIWVEKYRPTTVNECILPDRIKKTFLEFITKGTMPNLMLSGSAGTGKTTIARALCEDMNYEYMLLNASKERGIDMIRNTIQQVASTISLEGKNKAIILDEADGLTLEAQQAIKAAFEEHSRIKFILTCNTKNKLAKPIHSRTSVIEFKILDSEKELMMIKMLKRTMEILKKENITFDQKVVGQIVKRYYPDNRKILQVLQTHGSSGNINESLLETKKGADVSVLLAAVKDRDLGACRQWIANNKDEDPSILFDEIYNVFSKQVAVSDDNPDNILNLIDAVAECNYRANFAANQEVNVMALVAKMMRLEFKS